MVTSFFCLGPFNNLVTLRIKSNSVSCFTEFSIIWLLLISPASSHIFPLSHYTPITESFILAIFFIWNVFPSVLCIGGSFWTFGFYLNSTFSLINLEYPWPYFNSLALFTLWYLLSLLFNVCFVSFSYKPSKNRDHISLFQSPYLSPGMLPDIWKVFNKYWMDG